MSKSTTWTLWNSCHSRDSLTIITISSHRPLHITISKKNWGQVWILHRGTEGALMSYSLDTWLLIVLRTSLQLCLSVRATEKIMRLHRKSSVRWEEPRMGHLIAIIMDLMVVCTHLTAVERSNNHFTVAASLLRATPAKSTMTCRASIAPPPAPPSEEPMQAPSNLTSQIWAAPTLEAAITISMCQGTRNRHPNPCPTNPSCKARFFSKTQCLPGVSSIPTTNKMSRVCNLTRRGRRRLGVRTWFFILRCVALCFLRLRTAKKIIRCQVLWETRQGCSISMMRGLLTIITHNSWISRISRIWSCKTTSNHFRKRSKTLKIS
jgi:hypothetical protein